MNHFIINNNKLCINKINDFRNRNQIFTTIKPSFGLNRKQSRRILSEKTKPKANESKMNILHSKSSYLQSRTNGFAKYDASNCKFIFYH